MKKLLRNIKNELLFISLCPEIFYHLAIKQEMNDECLSGYFKWAVSQITKEEC